MEELEDYRKHGEKHVDVLVDATDIVAVGVDALVAELLAALGLAPSDLVWRQDPSAKASAEGFVAEVREYRRQKGLPLPE
jgi:hypothetical protein